MEALDTHHLLVSKENIQPLRQGRDTSKLCVALQAQTDSELQQTLEKQRNEFEIRLRSKNSDDPLSDWCDYIHWIEQSFPKQPREGKLHIILQKCLNKFKESEKYKNDVRFVKLCIKYAEIEGSTVELLSQIHRHGIGVQCAELYIAWAEKYVVNNCFKKANLIYEKGIESNAEPIDLLKEAHRNFHAFLGRRILNSEEEFKPTFLEPLIPEMRQAYNVLKPVATGQTEIVSNVRVGVNVKGSPGKLRMEFPKDKKHKNNIEIKIFEDPENECVLVEPAARLEKISNKKKLTKENTVKPGPWTEKQKKKVPFAAGPSCVPFEVHRDEEDPEAIHRPQIVPSSVLKSHSKNNCDDATLASIPLFYPEPEDESRVAMYCKDQVYAGGLEFQFEELRAIEYNKRIAERVNVTQSITDSVEAQQEIDDNMVQDKIKYGQSDAHSDLIDPNQFAKQEANDGELSSEVNRKNKAQRRKSMFCVPKPPHQKPKNKCLSEDILPTTDHSMNQTIHTKEALSEMQQLWFSKPASPLLNDAAANKQAGKSILKTAKPCFNLYIDESCLDNFNNGAGALDLTLKSSGRTDSSKPVNSETTNFVREVDLNPCAVSKDEDPILNYDKQEIVSDNKENFIPTNYSGPVGKSTRRVTGILTPAENIPFDPVGELESDDEDEDELDNCYYNDVALCNMTAVTENLTKAFQLPRNESTPNMRKSIHSKKGLNRSSFDHEGSYDEPENYQSAGNGFNQPQAKPDIVASANLQVKRPSPQTEGKGVDNLSVIVETSREYKSTSSSSSGISTLQTKSFKNFPNSTMDIKGASSTVASRSGFHKTKGLSLTGYEASTESIALKSRISMSDKLGTTKDSYDGKPPAQSCLTSVEEENDACEEEKVSSAYESNVIDVPNGDIDPFSDYIIDTCLKSAGFPSEKLTQNLINVDAILNVPKVGSSLKLGNIVYDVKAVLGEGSYARVFDLVNKSTGKRIIAKIQKPAFPWEYYIVQEVNARISNSEMIKNFMKIETAYFFQNASVLLTKPVEYGTLLDTVNILKKDSQICHMIAIYFTVEILRILDTLHSCKIIHADIKPDNFLVMKRNEKPSLQLIDFGRSIDMKLFPEGTTFTRIITTDGFTTTEMKTGKPWTYQVDFFGAANCSHCLLFGEYMKVLEKGGSWNIAKIIPRYWARTEWKNYFTTLLNIESCNNIPKISTLVDPFIAVLTDNKELDFILDRLNTLLKNY